MHKRPEPEAWLGCRARWQLNQGAPVHLAPTFAIIGLSSTMGKIGKAPPTAKQSQTHDTQLGKQIPEILHFQRPETPTPHDTNMAPSPSPSSRDAFLEPEETSFQRYVKDLPTRSDTPRLHWTLKILSTLPLPTYAETFWTWAAD